MSSIAIMIVIMDDWRSKIKVRVIECLLQEIQNEWIRIVIMNDWRNKKERKGHWMFFLQEIQYECIRIVIMDDWCSGAIVFFRQSEMHCTMLHLIHSTHFIIIVIVIDVQFSITFKTCIVDTEVLYTNNLDVFEVLKIITCLWVCRFVLAYITDIFNVVNLGAVFGSGQELLSSKLSNCDVAESVALVNFSIVPISSSQSVKRTLALASATISSTHLWQRNGKGYHT